MNKYQESEILDDIKTYIMSTYGEHYVSDDKQLQALDFLASLDLEKGFCQGNAIKYLARYGKKGGKNLADLKKAVHYTVLLIYFEHYKKSENGETINEIE